jgi:uncharacterized protein YbbK (DUF523 family)
MVNSKIKIAVSSCLLGEAVRYDGTDKRIEYITERLAKEYNLISLCPEMAIGMGVPRPPIHLVDDGGIIQVVAIDEPSNNMTMPLIEYGKEVANTYSDICGYIFKKDSPSCGTQDVKVMNQNGEYERKGQGIYAAVIMNTLPLLPVIDEEDFLKKDLMDKFLLKVEKYFYNLSLRA